MLKEEEGKEYPYPGMWSSDLFVPYFGAALTYDKLQGSSGQVWNLLTFESLVFGVENNLLSHFLSTDE